MNLNSVNEDDDILLEVCLPYMRGDVVSLLESTRRLEISTSRLDRFDEIDDCDQTTKPSVLDCLILNLEESYGYTDITPINGYLPVSAKDGYRRTIKDVNGNDFIHWDYIFIAAKK